MARLSSEENPHVDPAGRGQDVNATMTGMELVYQILTVLLVIASLAMLIVGFTNDSVGAIQQTSIFAAAAVFGILARIAQAARQGLEARRRR